MQELLAERLESLKKTLLFAIIKKAKYFQVFNHNWTQQSLEQKAKEKRNLLGFYAVFASVYKVRL